MTSSTTTTTNQTDEGWGGTKVAVNPLDVQVGGGHYKDFAIQPIEYCMRNHLDHCQSNVIKYTSRCKEKGGLEDIKKAIHYLELMAFFYYGETLGQPQK